LREIVLETKRLLLRRVTLSDAPLLQALDSDPEVIRYTDLGGCPSLAARRDIILPRWLAYYAAYENRGYWIAEEKASSEFLGWFHFRPAKDNPQEKDSPQEKDGSEEAELGYRLKRSAWGQGYATEMAQELVRRGFEEWGAKRITATALAANRASIRVMEKAGLRFEETYTYEFTNPSSGRTAEHPAVRYGLNKSH
jgi:RimJ/RimL family protein N-acetyltransferase